jgi:signal transduction histidine kinase/CheY-like chemotaxis protein
MRFRTDIDTLFKVSPEAKYVIFLPLYHFQRQCWFAATLGWVTDQTRAITVADISLLSAFGNSVVAEVSRYEALSDSRAKSNFISSISHELRSPLHGILASSELLRDGIDDPLHLSTIDMIESCGTALLDTFNNVLDHAKLNTGHVSGKPSELRLADLSELVEDVVEAVKLGSQSAFHSALEKDHDVSAEPTHHTRDLADHPILVILNVERFRTEIDVGAWTRIIMNIVGNALKYTSIGHIEVTLRLVQRDDAGHLCDYIYFAVEDTGAGMSPDYLKHKLFMPFSQENSFSPGIGLGLSIVQQLVSGLGGTVDVQSTVAVGSCIEVLVPVGGEHFHVARDTEDSHAAEALRGRRLCLITADSNESFTSSEVRSAREIQNRSAIFERAFRQNAGRSLGMDVILAPQDGQIPEADFYVADAGIFDGTENKNLVLPLVILCSGAGSPHCLDQKTKNAEAVHLHQAIGPKKLALALSAALRVKQSNKQSLNAIPGASPGNLNPLERSDAVRVEPVQDQPNPSAGVNPAPPQPPPQSPCYHILIVDDNPINVKLLAALVRKLNHTFATARNGLEAVQLYQNSLKTQRHFDVVFMDISMPIMNGFEATCQIRLLEDDAGAVRCKIVVLTGLSGDTSHRQAAASGTDLFLTKPVRLEKVKRILDGELDVM